jgi:hypothetical protein
VLFAYQCFFSDVLTLLLFVCAVLNVHGGLVVVMHRLARGIFRYGARKEPLLGVFSMRFTVNTFTVLGFMPLAVVLALTAAWQIVDPLLSLGRVWYDRPPVSSPPCSCLPHAGVC